MGCDLHWYSETKHHRTPDSPDYEWICDQANTFKVEKEDYGDGDGDSRVDMDDLPGRSRDYWFFGLLNCGVRTSWPWSFPYSDGIEGPPEDCSKEVKQIADQWDSDGHSHGSLTRAQLKAKLAEVKLKQAELLIAPGDQPHFGQAAQHHFTRLTEVLACLTSDVPDEDQRVVFWFDN